MHILKGAACTRESVEAHEANPRHMMRVAVSAYGAGSQASPTVVSDAQTDQTPCPAFLTEDEKYRLCAAMIAATDS